MSEIYSMDGAESGGWDGTRIAPGWDGIEGGAEATVCKVCRTTPGSNQISLAFGATHARAK